MIAPKLNEPDIDDIPAHLRKDIEFMFVEPHRPGAAEALEPEKKPRPRARAR